MADVNVLDLSEVTPGSGDSLILFDRTTGVATSTRFETLKGAVTGDVAATVAQHTSDIQALSNNTWQLKNAVEIPASSTKRVDLNTYTTVGNYALLYDNLVQYVDNIPSSIGAFNLVVMREIDSNYYIKQIILANDTNKFYIRSTYTGGNTWTDWNETVIDSDIANNLNTTSSGYVLDARQGKQLKDNTLQLKNAVEIPATSTDQYNLNAYTMAGTYTCSSHAASNYISNQPNSGYAFNLVVMRFFNSDSYIKQVLIYGDFDTLFIRHSYNGGTSWTDWEETALRSDRVRYLDFTIAVSASYGGKYYGETTLTYPDGNTNYIPVSLTVISNTDNLPATTQLAGDKVRVYADALGSAKVRVAYAKG